MVSLETLATCRRLIRKIFFGGGGGRNLGAGERLISEHALQRLRIALEPQKRYFGRQSNVENKK